jgi:hypothetical protein
MGKKLQLTGRPRLENGRRNKVIKARLTETEFNQVESLVAELGMTATDLVRIRVLKDIDKVAVNSREVLNRLDLIGTEMGHIGNNINQLARHANTMKLKDVVAPELIREFDSLFELYIGLQRDLERTLRSVMRLMANRS